MTRCSGHEAHFQVQLRELELTIAAQILVAEAAGNLEIAIHAATISSCFNSLRLCGRA